jgi:hypothetical protein
MTSEPKRNMKNLLLSFFALLSWEKTTLLDSDLVAHKEARQKFQDVVVVDSLSDKDAHRLYQTRAANPCDQKLK